MRCESCLYSVFATIALGFALVVSVLLSSDPLYADEAGKIKPKYADLTPTPPARQAPPIVLGLTDRVAALEHLRVALDEVGDGSSYVWHRGHGKLSGIVRPTASFKDDTGNICRHVEVMLLSGDLRRKTEAIACRLATGVWQFDG